MAGSLPSAESGDEGGRVAVVAQAAGPSPGTVSADDLAQMIATGIGLHNFAEGLAISDSAASGELSLAVLLVLGPASAQRNRGFRHRGVPRR